MYMEYRNMVLKNLFAGNNGETDREQIYGHGERGGEDKMYGENNMETYITMYKIVNGIWLNVSGNSNRCSVST